MIKFALRCAQGHDFESWFASNDAFNKLSKTAQVTCPNCGSDQVEKALMAPAVATSKKRADRETFASNLKSPPSETAVQAVVEAARAIRAHLKDHGEYVGSDFASQARARHDAEHALGSEGTSLPQTEKSKTSEQAQPDSSFNATSSGAKKPVSDRPLWGEATAQEARDLIEDGIAVVPIPTLPEDKN